MQLFVSFLERSNKTARSKKSTEERNKEIDVQQREMNVLLHANYETEQITEELNEREELTIHRADQSQLKFQLSKKDDIIQQLKEQLNAKKSDNESSQSDDESDNKEDYNLKKEKLETNINKHKQYKLTNITDQSFFLDNSVLIESNNQENPKFAKNGKQNPNQNDAFCKRCKRKGHYENTCYANLRKINSVKLNEDLENKVYVVYLDKVGSKNICSIKGLVDNKTLKLGLDCGATNSIMNHMKAIKNKIEILRSNLKIRTANGKISHISGITKPLEVNISGYKCLIEFLVFDHEDHDVLLGLDWFNKTGCGIFPSQGILIFKEDENESKRLH
ncbi:unnamed protein product [Brachionus calyciflorus]|uniref:Retropepsins domain-containing protein n=1 Tax=Brachionus calyciflorus TaxID=104777 RepID=A0A813TPG1_9BILA|nr:unnamed protein product [Brachionus calyciflorus]